MKFSQEQQKQYAEKLMIDQSFNQWDVASLFHLQAEQDLKEAQHTFDVAHQQSLMSRSDTEIITDELLFRGLVWMSSFSNYAYDRLHKITQFSYPYVTVSCTDEQSGWENYPVLYFTLKQRKGIDIELVDQVKDWLALFAHGRSVISCPVIYSQKNKFGQLRYEHDMRTESGRVVCHQQVLVANTLSQCLRHIAENWWYHPDTTILESG